jgi:branched-chain amino acid transport system ATP-binding protein
MELLGLNTYRKTIASNLDLYTTKLVMMAAGLATGCKLLMLDEPLAGLTIIEMNEFLLVARKVNQESGITILMIEHLLDALIEISDRMLILHNGEVIYTGSPDGVREDTKVIEVYLGEGE